MSMLSFDEETFRDLLAVLGDGLNPYQSIVDHLETTLDFGRRAHQSTSDVPRAKGGGDIASLANSAVNLLEEALSTAQQWRDAWNYHVEGGHFRHRSDF
jgi:hypothetical protein